MSETNGNSQKLTPDDANLTFSGTHGWLYRGQSVGVACWNCAGSPRALSPETRQPWHVVAFVHAGAFVLHTAGRSAVIDATSILLHNPEEPYRCEHPFGCCDRGSAIAVSPGLLLEIMAHHDPSAAQRPEALFRKSHAHGFSQSYLLQRRLVRALQGGGAKPEPMAVETTLLDLLDDVAAGCARLDGRPSPKHDPERVRRDYVQDAKALLQERYHEPLELDDVARSLYVSTFHLCRLFKEGTGMPIHRYLNRLRLREALERVSAGEMGLTDLALSVGFSCHSHFTRAFRREFGVPPSEIRRLASPGVANG
ncbi:MAG TPA: AraC family transcriptional regulator [Thermoanaerobaculia bacterium]|nr:AraC family transcriptional regulator [Thermoanaerobaculia bacterium]